MTRVALTGASGFLGRRVLGALASQDLEVHAIARSQPDDARAAQWHTVDLHDPEARKQLFSRLRADVLVHLAWYAEPGKFWHASENIDWVATSAMVLRAFLDAGGRRTVAVGSGAEYAPAAHAHSEADPIGPTTLYGACKHATHVTADAACSNRGASLAWARLFQLYGPGESLTRLVPATALAVLNGQPALCSSGEQIRDFIHVDDAAQAIALLASSDHSGTFNIGTGSSTSVADMVREIASQVGSPGLVRLGALSRGHDDHAVLVADISRLQALGWRPRFDIAHGVADTLAWLTGRAS